MSDSQPTSKERLLLRQLLDAIHVAWTSRQLSNAWMERDGIAKLLLDADIAAAPPHSNSEAARAAHEPGMLQQQELYSKDGRGIAILTPAGFAALDRYHEMTDRIEQLIGENDRLRASQPPVVTPDPEAMGRAVLGVQQFADDYVEGYEQLGEDDQGREGYYTPSDVERALILDAVNGLIADEDFITAAGIEYTERQKRRAAEGHCLECGCPRGQHYVKCSSATKCEGRSDG